MARWEPDARGRMIDAALELFAEGGFERTTALEIAKQAGVTERTFFRHFTDKREVLFDRTDALQAQVIAAIEAAPVDVAPLDAVCAAIGDAGVLFDRVHARRRDAVISANPGLLERELLKLNRLTAAIADALRARGVPELTATVSAEAGVAVFKISFARWIADDPDSDFAGSVQKVRAELGAQVSEPAT